MSEIDDLDEHLKSSSKPLDEICCHICGWAFPCGCSEDEKAPDPPVAWSLAEITSG